MRPICPECGSASCTISKRNNRLYAECNFCGHVGLKVSFIERVDDRGFRGEAISPGCRWIVSKRDE